MGTRPTVALIDRSALSHNYAEIRKHIAPTTAVMAIVKANAYGHGDDIVAKTLESLGCGVFGVAFAEEGVKLRNAGIKGSIVVLGGLYPSQLQDCFEFNLTPVVFDMDTAALLNKFASKSNVKKPIHVKIDSGMGRLGLLPHQVVAFFREFKSLENLRLEGVLSHLSEAEAENKQYTRKQLDTFLKTVSVIQGMGYEPAYLHLANSAAAIETVETQMNLIRPGLMLYGAYPTPKMMEKIKLKPVMRLKTQILQIRKMSAGSSISYGRTFMTTKESLIAACPVGYGDGLPWRLSGKAEAIVRGRRVPITGRICMDITMMDVTGVEGVTAGDEAIIIGSQQNETITVEEIAEKAGTIPYEIFTGISSRVPRLAL